MTVPDYALYEKCLFPSKWNAGHRSSWSLDYATTQWPIHCELPEWLQQFRCNLLRCKLIDTNFDYSASETVDQTLNAEDGVECFIEAVLQKN